MALGFRAANRALPRIQSHTFDITVRSATSTGDVFELKGKVDSGADANCISKEVVDRYGLEMIAEEPGFEKTFKTGNGQRVPALGQVLLKFAAGHDENTHKEHFHVVPGMNNEVLMGTPFINATGAVKMKGKFKDTEDEKAVKLNEETQTEPDVDVMAIEPSSKKQASSDAAYIQKQKALQAEKRKKRAAAA